MFTIEGSTALVTGGNRGIGKAIVDELLARGAARVHATSRTPFEADDPRIHPLVLDVTDPEAVAAAARAAADVSLVVNNAGLARMAGLLDGSIDDIRAELETNVYGLLGVSRAFAPVLARHESSALLNVLSALSWVAYTSTGYEVSKAAAWSATNGLRVLLAEQGTTVTALHMGAVDTDMTRGWEIAKITPREVALAALDGVAAGAFEVLVDDTARSAKAALAGTPEEAYPQLIAA